MNATIVASGTKAAPPVVSSIQDIPLAKIHESKTNPRKQWDDGKLAELAENIRQHGVLQPILVRPLPEGEAGMHELVAGARRFRASKIAKRQSIPATVRELTDAQALELQVIENVQRVDVHPLDEAQGYAALIQLQPNTYSVETIATRVGRSPAYVSGRLRLIQLIPEAKQAFYEDKLTVAHAFEVARLQPSDQRRALQECFPHHRNASAVLKDKRAEAVKSILTSQTHHLTRKTKSYCQRREHAPAAQSRLAAIHSCSRKFHGVHPFALTGSATEQRCKPSYKFR
jgi:ParB/RepB/Spo0J family partition protein